PSNAMWNARQLANEARALEAEGRAGDAAAAWARVAVKAESVAVRHPGSPQMDDALVLQREALARIGSCGVAVAPLRRVVQGGSDGSLRERAALVLAECALDAADPAAAGRALAGPLASRDRGRRSRAAYLAARAAVLRGDVPAALPDTLTRRRFVEGAWATCRAASLDELRGVARGVTALLESGPAGPVGAAALALQGTVRRVLVPDSGGDAALFRAGELARDSLGNARLAGRLFLRIVNLTPGSLFAPKALVAAAGLLPEDHDSLLAVLSNTYPVSPYTLAVRGEASPAYAAAEDSLARALGLEPRSAAIAVSTVRPPVSGRRGPALDDAP